MQLVTVWLTVRTLRWAPLCAAAAGAAVLLVSLRLVSDALPPAPTAVIVATVVGAALAVLSDPAAELLHALPATPRRRLAERVTLLAAPALLALVTVVATGRAIYGSTWAGPGMMPAGALAAAGLAVLVVFSRRAPADAADRAGLTVVAWAVGGLVASEVGGANGIASLWWQYPRPIAALAAATVLAAAPR